MHNTILLPLLGFAVVVVYKVVSMIVVSRQYAGS